MADLTFTIEMRDDGTAVLKGLKRAGEDAGGGIKGAVEKASASVDTLSSKALTAARAIGGMIGAGSIAALAALARSAFNAADAITDLSDVSQLSVKNLLGLEQITAKYGITVQEVAGGMRFLQRSLIESISNADKANDPLRRLGFTTNELLKLSSDPDGFLLAFGKKLAAIENPALRTNLALEAASRAGGRLAPVLLDIAQNGLPQVSNETVRAYKVIGEWADFLAVQAVKKIQSFNTVVVDIAKTLRLIPLTPDDRLAQLDSQIATLRERQSNPYHRGRLTDEAKLNGLLRERADLTEQIERSQAVAKPPAATAPGIDPKKVESVTDALKKQITALEGQTIALRKGDLAGLRHTLTQEALAQLNVKTLPASITVLIDKLLGEAAALEKAKFAAQRLDESTKALDQDMAELVSGFEELKRADLAQQIEQDKLAMDAFAQSVGAAFDALDQEEGGRFAGTRTATQAVATSLGDIRDRLKEIDSLGSIFGTDFDATGAKISAIRQAIEQLNRVRLDPTINEEAFNTAGDAIDRLKAQLDGLTADQGILQAFQGITGAITRGISDTLTGIRQGTQTIGEAVRNLGFNILLSVNEAITQAFIIQPLTEVINSFMKGLVEEFSSAGNNAAKKIAFDLGKSLGQWLKSLDLGSLFSDSGLFGSIASSIGTFLGSFFHDGGYIGAPAKAMREVNPAVFHNARRLHGGGLVAGERPIIARDDEFMMKGSTVRSIGVPKLREINETGRLPEPGSSSGTSAGGGREKFEVTLDFKGAQIIPRAPWTTPKDVVNVSVKSLRDQSELYAAHRDYGPKR